MLLLKILRMYADPPFHQNRLNLVLQVHPYAKMALGVLSYAAKV